MNREILRALKKSIEKWEKIVAKEGVDRGSDNCALCQISPNCKSCPVGHFDCQNTPYKKWIIHHNYVHRRHPFQAMEIKCEICERHAKAELEFLKSLLPEESS